MLELIFSVGNPESDLYYGGQEVKKEFLLRNFPFSKMLSMWVGELFFACIWAGFFFVSFCIVHSLDEVCGFLWSWNIFFGFHQIFRSSIKLEISQTMMVGNNHRGLYTRVFYLEFKNLFHLSCAHKVVFMHINVIYW